MLNPSSFEKMNVNWAVQLFAAPVTQALRLLKKIGNVYFNEAEGTVEFMETMWNFWQVLEDYILKSILNVTSFLFIRCIIRPNGAFKK